MSGLLQAVAALPADTPLFMAGETPITAGRIRATAATAAARLERGGRVYLHTASAALFVAGLIAAARKGVTVCCPAHVQPHYLREIGAEAGVLLTDQDVDFPGLVSLRLAAETDADAAFAGEPELVFYTSGVTGAPKLVRKIMAQIDGEALALERLWGRGAGRVFATVSHQHIYGMLFRVFWPVLSGRLSQDTPAEYWESLAGKLTPGTTLISSPAHLTRLPPVETLAGAAPGLVFSSGALLPPAAARAAAARFGAPPIEVLGSTETGGIAWRRQDAADALWTPFPDVAVATDADGVLSVTSPFADGARAVATGDVVEQAGGQFRLKGRADRIAKIDGKRVSLARVEDALRAHPMVTAAAATDLPLRKGALGAIVELNRDGIAALAEHGAFRLSRNFRTFLASRLEPSERPKHWVFGAIPLNSQGKPVRNSLRASFAPSEENRLGRSAVTQHAADTAEIQIELVPQMLWFEGHFPDVPVLAGIAQVHMAMLWADKLWQWGPQGAELYQLKFRHVLRPHDAVRLTLTRDLVRQRLKFAYHLRDIVASEGTLGGGA